MALPSLVPLLGSMAGMLAGPEIGVAAASALGISGTPAGSLMAQASPKSIGAGIASLAAGGGADEAVQNALRMSQDQMGTLGQPQVMPGAMPSPPLSGGMAPQMPQGMAPQIPQGMPPQMPPQMPQGMPPQGMPPQMPQMPQGMVQQGPGDPTQILAPRPMPQQPASLNTGLGTLRPQQGPVMPPMMKGFV